MVCEKFIHIIHPQKNVPHFLPTFSAIGTTTCNPARFFVPILKEFTLNKYTVSDSFSFCKKIKDQNSLMFMASFEI